jgi:hypothetical protein
MALYAMSLVAIAEPCDTWLHRHSGFSGLTIGKSTYSRSLRLGSSSTLALQRRRDRAMSKAMRNELRECVWLVAMVSGLSIVSVGLAVALVLVRIA